MSTTSKLYWLTRIDNIQCFLIVMGILLCISCAIFIIASIVKYDDVYDYDDKTDSDLILARKWKRNAIKSGIWAVCIFFLVSFVPSKEEVIFIVAGGKTIDYIKSDSSLKKLPYQSTELLSQFMDNEIHKLKGDTVKHK